MSTIQSPGRYDFVGSFLRPRKLKDARTALEAGKITQKELTAVEDEAIAELVVKQKELGFPILTDGEFRRATWHLDFMWAFDGIGHSPTKTGLPFHDEAAMVDDTYLTDKVGLTGEHPFIGHYRFLQQFEDENCAAKLTIPAPAQFLEQMIMPFAQKNTAKYYDDSEELLQDIASAYVKFIKDVYAAGCRNLQLDDCSWGMCADPRATKFFGTDEKGLNDVMERLLRINNLVLEQKPRDMVVNTHVCRGNFHSTYANEGAYDRVAEFLFAREKVDNFFLEYDDERSGGFAPLRYVPGNKKVVLGLITTKFPQLEDKEAVKNRICEAANYIDLDRLCLSPQCGFASCEIGNKLTEQEQWAKLALVRDIAREVWHE